MKKVTAIAVLIASTQLSAGNCWLKDTSVEVPGLGNVTAQTAALTTLGVAFALIKNCDKEAKDLPAEVLKALALESAFNKIAEVEIGAIKDMTPSNKKIRSVLRDTIKSILKNFGVNPAVDLGNTEVKKRFVKNAE